MSLLRTTRFPSRIPSMIRKIKSEDSCHLELAMGCDRENEIKFKVK